MLESDMPFIVQDIINSLKNGVLPAHNTLEELIDYNGSNKSEGLDILFAAARASAQQYFGNRVYVRALIEFTNFCSQDCLYCGLRRSNSLAMRYRLSAEDIMACCGHAHDLGFRTFVLQGGEDPWFTDDRLVPLVADIKKSWPDSALTLSVGERSLESYRRLRQAGADRFLLRHESASARHFSQLHPPAQELSSRLICLKNLKELGFQTGAGFMVDSPGQTSADLVNELVFLKEFQPEMVGIGPFLPHSDTPFAAEKPGSAEKTLLMLALVRLLLPQTLLPATTALSTSATDGGIRGILAGANVIMPNVSPLACREQYTLYDGKKHTGSEAGENLALLRQEVAAAGYQIVMDRGDFEGQG